jgi:hypothetical protein
MGVAIQVNNGVSPMRTPLLRILDLPLFSYRMAPMRLDLVMPNKSEIEAGHNTTQRP